MEYYYVACKHVNPNKMDAVIHQFQNFVKTNIKKFAEEVFHQLPYFENQLEIYDPDFPKYFYKVPVEYRVNAYSWALDKLNIKVFVDRKLEIFGVINAPNFLNDFFDCFLTVSYDENMIYFREDYEKIPSFLRIFDYWQEHDNHYANLLIEKYHDPFYAKRCVAYTEICHKLMDYTRGERGFNISFASSRKYTMHFVKLCHGRAYNEVHKFDISAEEALPCDVIV